MSPDKKIVDFPISPEERARRLKIEVERLSSQSPTEWMFWLNDSAEKHGIPSAQLKAMIEATIKAKEKQARADKAEDQRREQRVENQRVAARREEERQRREQQRAQEKADKEAERKQLKREKEFAALLKLPSAEHESRLVALAKRLDEDLEFLRDEFAQFAAMEEKSGEKGYVEPWPELVDARALLTELMTQARRYLVMHDDAAVAVTLWIAFAWLHDIAVHSPHLVFTSAEGDTGKTTACGVVGFLTPRPYLAAELTGPSLYRFVDHMRPTLIIDDADNLLQRRPDLVHIINVSWTRGTKIPRQHHGVTCWFDPFCPKVIAGVNVSLPKTTASRTVTIKLVPRLAHEHVHDFNHVDNDDFIALRRKLARFTADNAAALKDARPVLPPGFNNRQAMNWRLLLAIAERAGGSWPKRARVAAIKLARERRQPSEGIRLLEAFHMLFAAHGPMLTSTDVVTLLTAGQDSEWAEFRGRGPITKRQVALLLDPYDIHPDVIHPHGRKADRGYKAEWFADAFARYLRPTDSNRTTVRKSRGKRRR
jgi:putative DNA primase/helicase